MPKKKIILILGLALILAAGGIATASNMGFKFVKSYVAGLANSNTISLPYFQSQFTNAEDLVVDVPGTSKKVCKVSLTFQPTPCWFLPHAGGVRFPIDSQNGYIVSTNGVGGTTEVIVGSHNPAQTLSLTGPVGNSNLKSIPYHTTYANAEDMILDLPGANPKKICKVSATFQPTPCWFLPHAGGVRFPIVIGDALVISVTTTTATWIPDHY